MDVKKKLYTTGNNMKENSTHFVTKWKKFVGVKLLLLT